MRYNKNFSSKNIKKIIATLLIVLLFSTSYSYAYTTLYQKESEEKISSGTNLKKYTLYTDDGWLNINVLEVELDDKYTKLQVLTSQNGANKLQNVLTLAKDAYAIAAINGDFFSGSNGTGHSIGLSITDSNLISSASTENLSKNIYSSFLIDEDSKVFFDYLTNKITLTSNKTDNSIEISYINKYSTNYATPVIYTSAWGTTSLGSSETMNLTEMVVEDGKVTEIRVNEPAVEIPEDGFVVSTFTDSEGGRWIDDNFSKGTKVTLDITYTPDIKDIELAISGGSRLLIDGEIPESFSHVSTGRNPRTALGISEDSKTLYMVTVDGRQESSIGMTQTELAEFLKSINVYQAINLDGGGSTTMVSQGLGESELSITNNPSEGTLRSVINALGIVSTAPDSSKLYGLKISVDDTNIFQGEEREIKVTGYNKYYNPVEIDIDDIDWDYDGVKVRVKDGKVSGNTVGATTLIASIGKVETEIELNILSAANELFISPKKESIAPNGSVSYTIKAKNKNGYYANTNLESISSKIFSYYTINNELANIPEDAKIENHIFTAKTSGHYIIEFTKGDIKSYTLITVESSKENLLDDFENQTFSFDEYPDEVKGDATLSSEQVYSGNTSVKLEYDFRQDIQIRGAYIELNNPYTIPANATSLSFWVYNDSAKEEKLKIKLKNANGSVKLIVLEDGLTHNGWEEINYDLTNTALPATLSDIYLAQDDLSIKESGYIYVDHLIYYTNQSSEEATVRIPNDIKLEDSNNAKIETSQTYKIALLDTLTEPTLMIDDMKNKTLISSINKNADLTIFTEDVPNELLENISTEKILPHGYDLIEKDDITIIQLDISNYGIRKTDSAQWTHLQYDIEDSANNTILIVLNDSIDNFEDLEERKLFVDVLCEMQRNLGKDIYVLHTGYTTDYSMERGVKFLGINSKNILPENVAKESSYILISITGDQFYYEIKNIFE